MDAADPTPARCAWLGEFGRELRFALRSLCRTPVFSVVAIVSLGLGLALATTTLAITYAYLLRALPYPDGQRLFHVRYAPPGPYEPRGMTALDWSSVSDVVDAPITSGSESYFIGEGGNTRFVSALRASPGLIAGLSVRPVLGHGFAAADYQAGGPTVALIGHALWRDRFKADPNIVGREFRATPENNTEASTLIRIVGVLPPGFWFGRTSNPPVDLIVPLRVPARTYMVRLRVGVPVAHAERRITEAARAVGSDFRPDWTGVQLESVHDRYVAGLRPLLLGINTATALVFTLVCVNVAILVLLRAMRRQKEVAVRVALGAERRHLWRMSLAETGLMCAGALALGVGLTALALRSLAPVIEARLGRPPPAGPAAITVDWPVALVAGGAGVIVALSLAFLPLFTAGRRPLADALRRTGLGATDGPAMRRLRSALIAFEVAGALALLVGGGLMIRSVLNLVRTELGFDPQHVARVRVVLPSTYREPAALAQFHARLGERLAAAHPVSTLGSSFPPFYETHKRPLESDASGGVAAPIGGLTIGAGYFSVHGIKVLQGREFTLADRFGSEPVAIVSASLARQLWPDGNFIGRRLRAVEESIPDRPLGPWRTVVGVVRDVRQTYDDQDLRDAYFPFLQSPTRFANMQVRTDRPGALPLTRLGALVTEIDPFARVFEPTLLASEDQQSARARFMTSLLGGFAGFATLLALLGLYGVTAYAVQQREREIAIRVAVGATNHSVVRLFLREGAIVVGAGLGLGLLATCATGRVLASQIHGVQPFDLATLGLASAFLLVCALLAIWWPARRAANADLLSVLKAE